MYFQLFLRTQGKNQHQIKLCLRLVTVSSVAFLISSSSFKFVSQFFSILDNFQNAYLTLNIHISVKWHKNVKTISKLKLPHWLSKKISVLKISFFIVHFTLDQTGVLEIEETLLQRTNLLYVNNQHTQTSNLYSIH